MNHHRIIDQTLARIVDHGYTFIGVFDSEGKDPNFVYSVGLVNKGMPELLMIGQIPIRIMEQLLTDIVKLWAADGVETLGDIDGIIRSGKLRLIEVHPIVAQSRYAIQHRTFCPGTKPRFVQVLWPDAKGVFPTDPAFDARLIQPVLPEH